MKILVVEDNTVTATLMTGILTRHGYTVVLARTASVALTQLGAEPDIQGVITDIMMPGSSGLDLLQALRTHQTWRNLPTIVTTGRNGLGDSLPVIPPRPLRSVAKNIF